MALKTLLRKVIQCDKCTAQCVFQDDAESWLLENFTAAAMAHFRARGWQYGPGKCLCLMHNKSLTPAEYRAASELIVHGPLD